MSNNLIQLRDINVIYTNPDGELFYALRDVNLEITQGEYISLVGTSGSGKTTLANIMGMLSMPASGAYLFEDVDMLKLKDAQRISLRGSKIGFIFQDYILVEHLTALENVALALSYEKMSKKEALAISQMQLTNVGLGSKLHHFPRHLSGGQKQRVAIARALVKKPKILLADEPTGALDHHSRFEVLSILQDLNSQGITVITVTHSEEDAMASKRIVRVESGRIVSDSPQRKRVRFFGRIVTEDESVLEIRIKTALEFIKLNFGLQSQNDFLDFANSSLSSEDITSCIKQFKTEWMNDKRVEALLIDWFRKSEEFIKVQILCLFLKFSSEDETSELRLSAFKSFCANSWSEESSLLFLSQLLNFKNVHLRNIIDPQLFLHHTSEKVRASSTTFLELEPWPLVDSKREWIKIALRDDDGRVIANTLDYLFKHPLFTWDELRLMKVNFNLSARAKASWCRMLFNFGRDDEAMNILEPMLESSRKEDVTAAVWVMGNLKNFNLYHFVRKKLGQSSMFIGNLDDIISAFNRAIDRPD
jgi:putative ABC transport system ATP-binding protein